MTCFTFTGVLSIVSFLIKESILQAESPSIFVENIGKRKEIFSRKIEGDSARRVKGKKSSKECMEKIYSA